MKCGSKFGPVPKNRGAVGRASWLASFLGVPGAKFFWEKPGMGTTSKKEAKEGILPDSAFKLPEDRGGVPRSHEKVTKFREHLSNSR